MSSIKNEETENFDAHPAHDGTENDLQRYFDDIEMEMD